MITPVFRRRAERFAHLLDEASGARRNHSRTGRDDDLIPLVTLSRRVEDLPMDLKVDEEFRTGLRAALMATIEREGLGATALSPDPTVPISITARHRRGLTPYATPSIPGLGGLRGRRTRTALIVGLATGTLALSGMSAASGDAMPGDALYSVKRSAETAKLALAGSDVSRGQLYLEFAKTRISEAGSLAGDPTALAGVLGDLDSESRQGTKLLNTAAVERHDTAPLDVVDQFVTTQQAGLAPLAGQATGEAATKASSYATLLEQIRNRSKLLRTAISQCEKGTVSDTTDGIGPRPRQCAGAKGATKPGTESGRTAPTTEATGSGTATGQGTAATTGPGSEASTANSAGGAASSSGAPSVAPSSSDTVSDQDEGIVNKLGRIFDNIVP